MRIDNIVTKRKKLAGTIVVLVASAAAIAAWAGNAGSTPSLAAQVAQQAGQLSEAECAKAIEAYRYRGQILAPQDPLSTQLQAMLNDLALQESIQANTFISEEVQAGSAEAVWSLANACSQDELPQLKSPGILIGNDAVKQLDGRVAVDDSTLGTVRATVFEDANRQLECVHIISQHGLGGGACSEESVVVAQLQLWFCESSSEADIKRNVSPSDECQSAIPTAEGAVPPATVIVGATDESRLAVTLDNGHTLQETTQTVQGTARRFFAIPISGQQDAAVVSVEGMSESGKSEDTNIDDATSTRGSGFEE